MADRWVFLDVGNVLLDEDPLTYRAFRVHVEAIRRRRPGLTFAALLAERSARASAGARWPVHDVASAYLDESDCASAWESAARAVRAEFAALSPLIEGAGPMVDRLARRYRLGLVANQGPECRERLDALGLLGRFEVVALSEERGLFKPDPALFRWAMDRAGAPPSRCVMVGDRLDNDVAPARSLGMGTVWVRWPSRSAKGWRPDDPDAIAYRDALERSSRVAEGDHPRPDRAIDTIDGLEATLESMFINDI